MSQLVYAGLFPHPPLLVEGIGDEEKHDVVATDKACRQLAARIEGLKPDTLVLISPHGPVFADAYTVANWSPLNGSFTPFGSPVSMTWSSDENYIRRLEQLAREQNLALFALEPGQLSKHRQTTDLDHGTMVPLYYLEQAGWKGQVVCIRIGSLPPRECYAIGELLAQAASGKTAVIASGDMSHCLSSDAPSPYNPAGAEFDQLVAQQIQNNDFLPLLTLSPEFRQQAAECGWRPLVTLLGALSGWRWQPEVLSYEGPFGVGYLVAAFTPLGPGTHLPFPEPEPRQESAPVSLARAAIAHYLNGFGDLDPPESPDPPLDQRAGAFVSIKSDDTLRGCIGTFAPSQPNLAAEIIVNAVDAATEDPRFEPVSALELEELTITVDVLEPLRPASFEELDPATLGVVVEWKGRRGLLLPDLPGVTTPAQQVEIACQKAGIPKDAGSQVRLSCFGVKRYY